VLEMGELIVAKGRDSRALGRFAATKYTYTCILLSNRSLGWFEAFFTGLTS